MKLITEGKTSVEVAVLLYINARTIEHHRANIMDKLKLRNTAELIKYTINKGYA